MIRQYRISFLSAGVGVGILIVLTVLLSDRAREIISLPGYDIAERPLDSTYSSKRKPEIPHNQQLVQDRQATVRRLFSRWHNISLQDLNLDDENALRLRIANEMMAEYGFSLEMFDLLHRLQEEKIMNHLNYHLADYFRQPDAALYRDQFIQILGAVNLSEDMRYYFGSALGGTIPEEEHEAYLGKLKSACEVTAAFFQLAYLASHLKEDPWTKIEEIMALEETIPRRNIQSIESHLRQAMKKLDEPLPSDEFREVIERVEARDGRSDYLWKIWIEDLARKDALEAADFIVQNPDRLDPSWLGIVIKQGRIPMRVDVRPAPLIEWARTMPQGAYRDQLLLASISRFLSENFDGARMLADEIHDKQLREETHTSINTREKYQGVVELN